MILWEKVEMCFEEVSLFFYFSFKFWLSLAHCILGNDIRAEDFPKLKRITFRQNILIGRGGFGDVSNFGNGVTCVFHFLVLFWKLVFAITRATFIFSKILEKYMAEIFYYCLIETSFVVYLVL